jgi:hypothetical protein
MADQVAVFPDLPQHTQTLTWGDRQVRLRFTYRQRLGSWYLDIFETAGPAEAGVVGALGPPIVLGRRISARWAPLLGLAPEGLPLSREVFAVVDGAVRSEPYRRSDFGASTEQGTLRMILLDEEEIDAVADLITDPTATLIVVLAGP